MDATTIKSALNNSIEEFLTANSLQDTDTLTSTQNSDLTDILASKLETVNPNNNYPSTPK